VLVPAVAAAALVVCWLAYLLFCRWLVRHTDDPASLEHAATAARAFPFGRLPEAARGRLAGGDRKRKGRPRTDRGPGGGRRSRRSARS
jgi:hypothetical protein